MKIFIFANSAEDTDDLFIFANSAEDTDDLFIFANSAEDTDDLGHHCLPSTCLPVFRMKRVTGLQIRVHTGKLFFLLLNQTICCGYSKHMFKLMSKEINAVLDALTILIWTHGVNVNSE